MGPKRRKARKAQSTIASRTAAFVELDITLQNVPYMTDSQIVQLIENRIGKWDWQSKGREVAICYLARLLASRIVDAVE